MRLPGSGRYCAVSVPNAWNLHVVRVHNAGGDKQAMGTAKERAVDLLVGIIQGCGYGDGTLEMLYGLVKELTVKPACSRPAVTVLRYRGATVLSVTTATWQGDRVSRSR